MPTRKYNRHAVGKSLYRKLLTKQSLFRICIGFGVLLLIFAGVILWWSRDLPDPSKVQPGNVAESTKIYDSTGTHLLYEVGDVKHTQVALDQISKNTINATLAAEDDQFYKEPGISITGMLRGVILKPLSGQRAEGGSTITQQLVKNSLLTSDRTLQRKVKELVLALEIEQRFSKDQILSMYLNSIPYGSRTYGIEAAAQTFFGTSSQNLDISQSAILAALIQAPTHYSPYGSYLDDLKNRQQYIIGRMLTLGMITKEQADQAKAEPLAFQPQTDNILAPHFVFYIEDLLDKEYGAQIVDQGGLKIITTLDMNLQTIAENTLKQYQSKLGANGAKNASLVAINPKNGNILAMVGSIDYFNKDIDGNVNVSIRNRSPGSSIKPFVYAQAFSEGYRPETLLVDASTDFGQGYKPQNYDLKDHGIVSMRTALDNSLNIPAVQTLYLAGVKNVVALAQQMGIPTLTNPDRYGLSLVLGGGEVTLLDMTSAYGVFANEGVQFPPQAILKIDHGNENLFDASKNQTQGNAALDPQIARMITNVLSDNNARGMVFGLRSPLQLGARPVAAKTGTSQDFRDGWTYGYTPSLVAGVWTGNNDNSPMRNNSDGVVTAGPIWNSFMRQALTTTPIEQFTPPEPLPPAAHGIVDGNLPQVQGKWDQDSQTLYTLDCPINVGQVRTIKELHSILYYTRKGDPNGEPPAQAEADPQFANWEASVAAWRDKHNQDTKDNPSEPIYVPSLPTPTCNVGSPDELPKVEIVSPNTTILKSSPVKVTAQITPSSDHQLQKVRFLLDGQEIASLQPNDGNTYNASFSFDPSFAGRKTLVIQAITQDNLIGSAHRTFIINPDPNPPTVTLHTPQDGSTIASFPYTIKISATAHAGIDFVDVLYTKDGGNGTQRIARVSNPSANGPTRYDTVWQDSAGPGIYHIYAVAYDKTGNTVQSDTHTVTVQQ
ncbi:MAG TPA: transglycosylase domain-containing protein [Candidatus Andersenbacteria bacterium]|nr:transglycosylase domain-containing protein [Candidatus Andersenbacteria bacterium]